MWQLLGGLAGGIGSYLGGQENAKAAVDAAQINAQAQEQTNAQNIAYQTEFAQNGVQWKAADARAAGINPLAALGANTASFSNVVAPQPGAANARPGDALSGAGQSVGRAIASTQSADDQAFNEASRALMLQKAGLQNELLQSQIESSRRATTFQPGNGPSTPSPAQTYSGGIPADVMAEPGTSFSSRWDDRVRGAGVDVIPDKVTQGVGNTTAGLHPEVSLSRSAGEAGFYPYPSHDMSVAMFNPWSQRSWDFRNLIMPMFSDDYRPPALRSDRGYSYSPLQGYYPTPSPRTSGWGYYLDRNHWIY